MMFLHSAQHFLVPAIFFIVVYIIFLKRGQCSKNLPPSPPSLPIIGHLHLLSLPLHQTLCRLSKRYGPVILLRFGSRPILVVSSLSAINECFTTHDITFANRPHFPNGKHITYNYTAVMTANYGSHWRNLRRVTSVEVLSPPRIRTLSNLFNEEIRLMIKELSSDCTDGNFVKMDMRTRFSDLIFNIMMKILDGKRCFGANSDRTAEESKGVRNMIEDIFYATELVNPADFLPFLRWFGFRGFQNECIRLGKNTDRQLQKLMEERRRERGKEETTVLDVLLSLQESDGENYNDELIKGMMLVYITPT